VSVHALSPEVKVCSGLSDLFDTQYLNHEKIVGRRLLIFEQELGLGPFITRSSSMQDIPDTRGLGSFEGSHSGYRRGFLFGF